VPLAPELFSIMADARLALGQISPERYSCDTADGAGKDRQAALRRLARSVCADLEEIGEGAAMAIAEQACSRQKKILVAAISRQATEHGLEKVVAAGTGEGLIAEAAAFLGMECLRISEKYGSKISDVFPGPMPRPGWRSEWQKIFLSSQFREPAAGPKRIKSILCHSHGRKMIHP